MMRILLTAIIFCSALSFNAIAQPKSSPIRLEVKAVVSLLNTNDVYVGIDNLIHVAVPGYTCEQLIVTTNNGKIKGQKCEYMLRPDSVGDLMVYISVARNAEVAIIDSFYFRSGNAPYAQPVFGRYSIFSDTIDIYEAMAVKRLFAMGIWDFQFEVFGFTMKVIRNCSLVFTGTSKSSEFSLEMEQIQSTFKKGDVLIFEQIKVDHIDESVQITNPLRFILH